MHVQRFILTLNGVINHSVNQSITPKALSKCECPLEIPFSTIRSSIKQGIQTYVSSDEVISIYYKWQVSMYKINTVDRDKG